MYHFSYLLESEDALIDPDIIEFNADQRHFLWANQRSLNLTTIKGAFYGLTKDC